MRIDTREVFKFEELEKDIQQKVIFRNRDINVSYDDWDLYLVEEFYDILRILGYTDTRIHYSGFCSQGDGASFEARWSYEKGSIDKIRAFSPNCSELLRIAQGLQNLSKRNLYSINARIITKGYYSHSGTMYIDYFERNNGYEPTKETDYEFIELSRDLANYFYDKLYNEYFYLMEDEQVIDTIIVNEYEYTEKGELV